jgi:hypothetical protein
MDAKNHSSGVHGLSFCPFHRVCPGYQLADKGISGQENESYQRLSALIYDQIQTPCLFVDNAFIWKIVKSRQEFANDGHLGGSSYGDIELEEALKSDEIIENYNKINELMQLPKGKINRKFLGLTPTNEAQSLKRPNWHALAYCYTPKSAS